MIQFPFISNEFIDFIALFTSFFLSYNTFYFSHAHCLQTTQFNRSSCDLENIEVCALYCAEHVERKLDLRHTATRKFTVTDNSELLMRKRQQRLQLQVWFKWDNFNVQWIWFPFFFVRWKLLAITLTADVHWQARKIQIFHNSLKLCYSAI